MEFDVVDDGGVWGDSLCALSTESHLAGEIEAVGASCGHHAKAFEESWHHLVPNDVSDGFAVAVCLVEDMAVGEAALVVEDNDAAQFGDGTITLLDHFVVEAFVTLLDVGVFLQELGEIDLFALFGFCHLAVLAVLAVCVGHLFQIEQHAGGRLLCERLLFAVESDADGLHKNLTVDVDASGGDVLSHRESKDPAEAVVNVLESGSFLGIDNYAFVA